MRFLIALLLALAFASPALAGPQSTIGGKRLETDMAHKVGSGWPSTHYEWWNKGQKSLDWALGAELAVPVSIDVNPKVDIVTGAAIPVDLGWVEGGGFFGAVPLLVRLGVEIKAGPKSAPFVLIEVGPGIGFGDGQSEVTLAARLWAGTSFWSITGK